MDLPCYNTTKGHNRGQQQGRYKQYMSGKVYKIILYPQGISNQISNWIFVPIYSVDNKYKNVYNFIHNSIFIIKSGNN